ncbi:MAG TPA: MDR family MFS transporter [Candidatus Paceibacterota bacterium]|nr:MDR family MFS transporter [Candidatus Paceibacterota bacterium]
MTETAPDPALASAKTEQERHGSIMLVMGALMLTMLLAALDQTIVSTALPRIASEFNALSELSWVVTAYLITSAVVTPLYGKLSDIFGRKRMLMLAVVIFLIGSVLSGISQSMLELILFRGIQGIGAGGLMTMVFATIGDIVTPRERGRYQGYIGAVFGVSSVIGPLLGGFLTDSVSWRWIFYINVPLGLLALAAIALRLNVHVAKRDHAIDYLGALFLSISIVCLLLVAVWGGTTYPWSSQLILSLGALGVLFAGEFVWWETRAKEPLLPLSLFRNSIFSVSSILSFVSGLSMFAAIIYLPEYLQAVRGYSATASGLLMVPLVVGILTASITSGRLISSSGKYRIFPLVGTLTTALGLFLMSGISVDTPIWLLSVWMIIIGAGIGMFMQVMTLSVQNAVDQRDLGTATATVTFFRSIGSSFGTSIFGAVLVSRFAAHIVGTVPAGAGIDSSIASNLSALAQLPPALAQPVFVAFTRAFDDLFLYAAPAMLLAFVVALFLREVPLRTQIREEAL